MALQDFNISIPCKIWRLKTQLNMHNFHIWRIFQVGVLSMTFEFWDVNLVERVISFIYALFMHTSCFLYVAEVERTRRPSDQYATCCSSFVIALEYVGSQAACFLRFLEIQPTPSNFNDTIPLHLTIGWYVHSASYFTYPNKFCFL